MKSTLPNQPVSAFLIKGGRGLLQALDILITKTDSTNPTVTITRQDPKYNTALQNYNYFNSENRQNNLPINGGVYAMAGSLLLMK